MKMNESSFEMTTCLSEDDAWKRFKMALERLGTLQEAQAEYYTLSGKVNYGFQPVTVKVTLTVTGPQETTIKVVSSSISLVKAGAENVNKRLITAFERMDDQGWKPDKVGLSRIEIFFYISFFTLIVGIGSVLILKLIFH